MKRATRLQRRIYNIFGFVIAFSGFGTWRHSIVFVVKHDIYGYQNNYGVKTLYIVRQSCLLPIAAEC